MSRYSSRRNGGRGGSTRPLFDPRVDNPISFNAALDHTSKRPLKPQSDEQNRRTAIEEDVQENYARPPVARGSGKLWQASNGTSASTSRPVPAPAKQKAKEKPRESSKSVPAAKTKTESEPKETHAIENKPKTANPQKELHKKQIKALFAALQAIEARIGQVSAKARQHPFFQDTSNDENELLHSRSRDPERFVQSHPTRVEALTDSELRAAHMLWSESIDLHIELADKYLELIQFDYALAEKKNLENLCWKRAIYSVVDQLRKAVKLRNERLSQHEYDKSKMAEAEEKQPVMVPKITGTGMIMVKVEGHASDDDEGDVRGLEKELALAIACFEEFLEKADDFYRRLSVMLRKLDEAEAGDVEGELEATELHLQGWRRTRRLRWYKCIPNRGDLARYRWMYAVDQKSSNTSVECKSAFEEAWRWYALGLWLMPAGGKLYSHLVLLLSSSNGQVDALTEMHKLYFSARSVMVRRNAFRNAREGMVVLFENNRLWFNKYVEQPKLQRTKSKRKETTQLTGDAIAGTLIRLHGMLFTKIGLDLFSETKRLFFESLFASARKATTPDQNGSAFDGEHAFWFEAAVLSVSSLYSYDYEGSKLSKLVAFHHKSVFADDLLVTQEKIGVEQGDTILPKDEETYASLITELKENVLFSFSIDLACQLAIELFRRYLDPGAKDMNVPSLPALPRMPTTLRANAAFLFDPIERGASVTETSNASDSGRDPEAWMVYVETLLQWILVNGLCVRKKEASLWESLFGAITSNHLRGGEKEDDLVSAAFWSLLIEFANALLRSLPDETRYTWVDFHLLDGHVESEPSLSETQFATLVMKVLGARPTLPEEQLMRGLGWLDDMTGKALRLISGDILAGEDERPSYPIVLQRKLKVLDYVFALTKQMSDVAQYDPVDEKFIIMEVAEDSALPADIQVEKEDKEDDEESTDRIDLFEQEQDLPLTEIDDAVLLSNKTDALDDPVADDDDDMMTQLKKRREELQSVIALANAEKQQGYRRLPGRVKEREARMNYLRDRVIPGQTTLVLDTNCFIGHLVHIKRLITSAQWVVVVPLVVITELDGLRSNSSSLGKVAGEAIDFIEQALASKQRRTLRIQTSHHHFIYDISIRSEQFVFGETDRNLDDLVLSACLWWMKQSSSDEAQAPVCLVTGDRNLSVKARARDVEVVPVSGIMRLQRAKNTH